MKTGGRLFIEGTQILAGRGAMRVSKKAKAYLDGLQLSAIRRFGGAGRIGIRRGELMTSEVLSGKEIIIRHQFSHVVDYAGRIRLTPCHDDQSQRRWRF